MKKAPARRNRNPAGAKRRKNSGAGDPFFTSDGPTHGRKRRPAADDDIVDSEDSSGESAGAVDAEDEDDELAAETAEERRLRLAKKYLEEIKAITGRGEEEEAEEGDEDEEEEEKGRRDELVGEILQQEQLVKSGRLRRLLASRIQKPEPTDGFRIVRKHRQPVTAVALSEDDSKGFSASKDGIVLQWDLDSGKSEKYVWPAMEKLVSHGAKIPMSSVKWSRHVLALAVSSDGRYLATGGLDRHVHLWDTRSREHIQAFPGHRGAVSCLAFRQGTTELMSGSFDRTIKLWNAEDRAYMDTLFGHQSDVLTIDCLRKERLLTVGRDRTMRLWKVPEESQLVFRAPASNLESCCFINNEEFLSGSDDGSVELWSIMRKKPAFIVKNAHVVLSKTSDNKSSVKENGETTGLNNIENGSPRANGCSSAQSWVGAVSVCGGSDLAASGAANGAVRLWAIESSTKSVKPLFDLPLDGFVNSLVFARSGRFIVAGLGQEPRLGRWGRLTSARNGVLLHSLRLSGG